MGVYKGVLINGDTIEGFDKVIEFIQENPDIEEHTIKGRMVYIIETIQKYLEDDSHCEFLEEDFLSFGSCTRQEYEKEKKRIMDMKVHHLNEFFYEVFNYIKTGEVR